MESGMAIRGHCMCLFAAATLAAASSCSNNQPPTQASPGEVASFPLELWNRIPPYALDKTVTQEDVARTLREDAALRSEVMAELSRCVEFTDIGHEDQVRMGMLVLILQKDGKAEEAEQILKLMRKGQRHADFYALALSCSPQYFAESLEVLKKPRMRASFPDPASGERREYVVQDRFLTQASNVTGENFGSDYRKWIDWWEEKGATLDFDRNTGSYINPENPPKVYVDPLEE